MRARAEASLDHGFRLDLMNLVVPYGRDRRVSLRVERMPGRARLSRGRNNGDGSWSLTREELDGLSYFPPRGSSEIPTLVVRVIGLDSDNGATLEVVDVVPGDTDDDDELHLQVSEQEAELKKLKAELAKTKTALRGRLSDLAGARKTFEAELEERLAEAQAEAAAQTAAEIEKARAKWQSDAKERTGKHDTRAEERLARARESWRREAEAEIGKAEDAWKVAEQARLAAAEARWREDSVRAVAVEKNAHAQTKAALAAAQGMAAAAEAEQVSARRLNLEIERLQQALGERDAKLQEAQSAAFAEQEKLARDIASEKAAHTETQAALAAAQKAAATPADSGSTRQLNAEIHRLQQALKEREAKIEDVRSAASAAEEKLTRAKEESARERKEFALKVQQIETRLDESRISRERNDTTETKRLRSELATAAAKLAERDRELAEAQALTAEAGERASELQSALQKTTEAGTATESARQRRFEAETRRLRADLQAAEAMLSERDRVLAEIKADASDARQRETKLRTALEEAEANSKKRDASRLGAIKAEWEAIWRKESQDSVHSLQEKLRNAEHALAEMRAQSKLARDKRGDTAEMRRLSEEIHKLGATLDKRDLELADAQAEAHALRESAKRQIDGVLSEAKKEWEAAEAARFAEAKAEWERHSSRVFKKAQIRLEAAEVALAEARAEASAARDRRDSAEFRRLRAEFAAASAKLADCEAQLAEAQLAAGRARERTREEVEAAVAKAEEAWKAGDAVRVSGIEMRERERGARALAEATARLERTETALAETRHELERERERAALQLAEVNARFERSETARTEATEQIETMRDPANEMENRRLRTELANLQVAYADREAELSLAQATARKVRERTSDQMRAAMLKAEDEWRREEAERFHAARLDWEREARLAAEMAATPEALSGTLAMKRANRLLLDGALAIGLIAVVVLGVTFYRHTPLNVSNAAAALPPRAVQHTPAAASQTAALPMTIASSLARLRTKPNIDATVVATLRRGAQVSLLEHRGTWAHVHTDANREGSAADGWTLATNLRDLSQH